MKITLWRTRNEKGTVFILLAAEVFVGTVLMIALWDSHLYIPIAIAVVATLAMLTWHIILLVKATDTAVKSNIFFRIIAVTTIPIAVFVITYIVIAVVLIIAFSRGGY